MIMGNTLGPGIDDVSEPTEEERKISAMKREAYENELASIRVDAREPYKEIGKELKTWFRESEEHLFAKQQKLSKKEIEACKLATKDLGYSFKLFNGNKDTDTFSISVEYHGYLSGKGGNIHHFAATGIEEPEKCLQLVADFSAIGCRTTTFYQNHYCSINDTARLHKEMESWGVCFEKKETSKTKGLSYINDLRTISQKNSDNKVKHKEQSL